MGVVRMRIGCCRVSILVVLSLSSEMWSRFLLMWVFAIVWGGSKSVGEYRQYFILEWGLNSCSRSVSRSTRVLFRPDGGS